MTREEVDRVCELFAHVGMIPVPIAEWRDHMAPRLSTPQSRCLETAADLMQAAKIDSHYVNAVREAAIMATKIKATIKDGKVKPVDSTPAPLRKGKAMKAARTEKGLRANREKRK